MEVDEEVHDQVPILAVDDKEENLEALESILTDPRLRLVMVRSGHEALKKLLHEEFAVILMDASMPVMDGFETAKTIRSRAKARPARLAQQRAAVALLGNSGST
jgi:CheY-like chemotaxis protein